MFKKLRISWISIVITKYSLIYALSEVEIYNFLVWNSYILNLWWVLMCKSNNRFSSFRHSFYYLSQASALNRPRGVFQGWNRSAYFRFKANKDQISRSAPNSGKSEIIAPLKPRLNFSRKTHRLWSKIISKKISLIYPSMTLVVECIQNFVDFCLKVIRQRKFWCFLK